MPMATKERCLGGRCGGLGCCSLIVVVWKCGLRCELNFWWVIWVGMWLGGDLDRNVSEEVDSIVDKK